MMKPMLFAAALVAFLPLCIIGHVVPPHPDFAEEYNRIRRRRQRRSLLRSPKNNSTKPVVIVDGPVDPRFCHELSESECRRLNALFGKSAATTLSVLKEQRMLKTLVLLMKFTDHNLRELPSKDQIEVLWNSNQLTGQFPTGSIALYLEKNSYGTVNVQATVQDWALTDNTEKHYSFSGASGLTRAFSASIVPLLQQLDDQNYDFSQHDLNNDTVIDNLVILHSGYQAEIGQRDCTNGRPYEDRIWSHAIPTLGHDAWISRKGYKFSTYMVASALKGICGSTPSNIGVMTHELIHTWGIPDLYDTGWEGKGTGHYTIMSNPFGYNGQQTHPGFMDPWSRIKSGFLEPIEIYDGGLFTIRDSTQFGDVYIYKEGFPDGEYLLIENRQQLEYDQDMKGSGLLVWHIDEAQPRNSIRGYPNQGSAWPANGEHYMIALLQADGNYDLEEGNNSQDAGDFFVKGYELSSRGVKRGDQEYPHPNTDSYKGGNIQATGFRLYDISESGPTMTFRVSGIGPPSPPTSTPSSAPSPIPTISPTPKPSTNPTAYPTISPSASPSVSPSSHPSVSPTSVPSPSPSIAPTPSPSFTSSVSPTAMHSDAPSSSPTASPSKSPTIKPSAGPTLLRSDVPTSSPSTSPSPSASSMPPTGSASPTAGPTVTQRPSNTPTLSSAPTLSLQPTTKPSISGEPTGSPTEFPSGTLSKKFLGTSMSGGFIFSRITDKDSTNVEEHWP